MTKPLTERNENGVLHEWPITFIDLLLKLLFLLQNLLTKRPIFTYKNIIKCCVCLFRIFLPLSLLPFFPSFHLQPYSSFYTKCTTCSNEDRSLGKLGTLPPGLIAFYSSTKPLDKSWHILGLGYNPSISMDEINNAAVIYFNGNMKPWLDIALNQFKHLQTKYVDYEMELMQVYNFGL
ncbi:hypothetical protein CsSME_00051682 [Camellia sinensis var. sinensis]